MEVAELIVSLGILQSVATQPQRTRAAARKCETIALWTKCYSLQCETRLRISSSVRVLRTRDRDPKKYFGDGTIARNACFLIVAVGSPDVVGRLGACDHRANCQ